MKIGISTATGVAAMLCAFSVVALAQMVGGYKTIATDDTGAAAAADFAVNARSEKTGAEIELIEVEKAERQVVQGTNYRLDLRVDGVGDEESCATVVVYYNLKKQYQLSSWVATECSEDSGVASADGFTPISKNHGGAELAAEFAVKEQQKQMRMILTLDDIHKAEIKEVVGGNTDFRLCLDLGANGQRYAFKQAVVSMDQYSNLKMVSWTDSDCGASSSAATPAADAFAVVENTHAGIVRAAKFAVKKHSEDTQIKHSLVGILKGEVKGMLDMTYRICMNVGEDDETQMIRAIVTMDQYSNLKMVSWEHAADCNK